MCALVKKVMRGETIGEVGTTGKKHRTAFALRSALAGADYESGKLLFHGLGC